MWKEVPMMNFIALLAKFVAVLEGLDHVIHAVIEMLKLLM
jgi:hypothetical protein